MGRDDKIYPVMDTERQLLFGLLALRAGLIQARSLAAAWSAWCAQPDHPLADLLVEWGHLTRADSAAVEVLLEREIKKHDGKPSGLSADERRACEQLIRTFKQVEYARMMAARPQTLYGIADSPVGLAAWLIDHNDADGQPAAAVFAALSRTSSVTGKPRVTRSSTTSRSIG